MKVKILLGFKAKVTLYFKSNSTPLVMYVSKFNWEKGQGEFSKMSWTCINEDYQFNIDEVIAIKYKLVWNPFR